MHIARWTALLLIGLSVGCSHKKKDEKVDRICLAAKIYQSGKNLVVQNLNSFDWNDVQISVNETTTFEGFQYSLPKIPSGATINVPLREFIRDDGMRFKVEDFVYRDGSIGAKEGLLMKDLHCDASKPR
jgi:hypothetical protein